MPRRTTRLFLIVLTASACSGGDTTDASATYFQDAAAISSTYESAAADHFADYQSTLALATDETGDAIFVDANKGLFAGLATEFGSALTGLTSLTPPGEASDQHQAWLSAAQALDEVLRNVDRQLTSLSDAPNVESVISNVPLADLQANYRAACSSVAELTADDPATAIACQPPSDS